MMLSEGEVMGILQKYHSVLDKGHFVYAKGGHGTAYVNKDAVYPHTMALSRLCGSMAERAERLEVSVVVGPVLGGVSLSQWTAFHLSRLRGEEVLAVPAEKKRVLYKDVTLPDGCKTDVYRETGDFYFGRGYADLVNGNHVLIVEDILNTGGSVEMVVEAVVKAGGIPVGVVALCNRGGVTASKVGVDFLEALVSVELENLTEEECKRHGPCSQKIPINTMVGHGAKYVAAHGQPK